MCLMFPTLSCMGGWGYIPPPEKVNFGVDFAVGPCGSVYVAGGAGSDPNAFLRFVTSKYSKEGKCLWEQRYDGPVGGHGLCSGLVVDKNGNAFVTGVIPEGDSVYHGRRIATTIKYDADGKQLWISTYDTPKADSFFPTDIVIDATGDIYLVGEYWIDNPLLSGIWPDPDVGPTNSLTTVKYDSRGRQLWSIRHNDYKKNEYSEPSIMVDRANNIYVTSKLSVHCEDIAPRYFTTVKYSSNGKQLWASQYTEHAGSFKWVAALTVDAKQNVFITGSSATKDFSDLLVIKYDRNGMQQFLARHRRPGSVWVEPEDIALDQAGNVYVAGTERPRERDSLEGPEKVQNHVDCLLKQDPVTLKYDASGKKQWEARYNSPRDATVSVRNVIVDDRKKNIYVLGFVAPNWYTSEGLVITYDPNGTQKSVRRLKNVSELVKFLSSTGKK